MHSLLWSVCSVHVHSVLTRCGLMVLPLRVTSVLWVQTHSHHHVGVGGTARLVLPPPDCALLTTIHPPVTPNTPLTKLSQLLAPPLSPTTPCKSSTVW
ncbi:hypothetical protein EDD17DRAFT_741819 [Pisolithus thermaeus]|nr:hypothetical protein EDD17DRAFT_741819 [Pisolithus thermaeus]